MANPGRPKKQHPAEDLHFRTSADPATAVATPVAADADEAGASSSVASSTESDAPAVIQEAVVENPGAGYESPAAISAQPQPPIISESESPVEQKIHQLVEAAQQVDLNGWQPIDTCHHRGLPVRVTEIPAGDGTVAHWKRTRVFNGKRWEETGKWVDNMTGMDLPFPVKYWKDRF